LTPTTPKRIRELAVQSANSTNSASDRAALDLEVQQRLAEIDRVATQSSFNGVKILDGSFGDATFQVGANVGDTISIALGTSMRQSAIGAIASTTSTDLATDLVEPVAATPTTSTALGAVTASYVSTVDAQSFALEIDGVSVLTVVQAGGVNETIDTARLQAAFTAFDTAEAGYTVSGTLAGGNLVVSKTDGTDAVITLVETFATGGTTTGSAAFVATHTNGTAAVTGTPLVLAAGDLSVQVGTDTAVAITGTFATKAALVDHVNTNVSGALASLVGGELKINSTSALTIAGTGALGLATTATTNGSLAAVNVADVAASNDTIQRVDAALTSVSTLRSTFGAIQNRFESVIANLSTTSENLNAARSRIQDADFAIETANLSRAQILQQAGTAMVAQANQLPQGVLALLRQ